MEINRIELCNFGSYAGINIFDISGQNRNNGKVVLIGGKNGAGKTTLFSGIKLCLYGYRANGFQNLNSHYRKDVKKYFNDAAKFDLNAVCYVSISLRISNGHSIDEYVITRKWNIFSEKLEDFENFTVERNSKKLTDVELIEFESYILSIIPPELFELFFFDGEKIADYLLESQGNETIKNAFMVLCGYDVFEIIKKNFKRISYGKNNIDADGTNYISAKENVDELLNEINTCNENIKNINADINSLKHEIVTLDKSYRRAGGILQDELNKKIINLKDEERLRDEKNSNLKKYANEIIPFIILKNNLIDLQKRITEELDKEKIDILKKSITKLLPKAINNVFKSNNIDKKKYSKLITDELLKIADKEWNSSNENILNLSSKEALSLQTVISNIVSFDKTLIKNDVDEIEKSIQRSKIIRDELNNSSVEGESDYLNKRTLIESKCESKQLEKEELINNINALKIKYNEALQNLKRVEKKLDEQLKSQSIVDLSQKSVAFLDKLQSRLYESEIKKVENSFMLKIKELARKDNFIDKIIIDNGFNVHIYKNVKFELVSVVEKLKDLGEKRYKDEYGDVHVDSLLRNAKCNDFKELMNLSNSKKKIVALQEIDKTRLSKGEKQVFIMALYWALVSLTNHSIPFIIDTPFARIDTEHRSNITKKFFMDLNGQVFIFSTNEEITGTNYTVIKKSLQAKFLLENTNNINTTIKSNKYFGE